MISEGLKKVIFKKLYKDLGKAEIINYNGNIWFIDRGKKYWYFELTKDGILWWRYSFFESFFALFSFDSPRFEPIIKDWVEEVLNYKVNTTSFYSNPSDFLVEEVLNHKVTTLRRGIKFNVEEVLNHKVDKTASSLDKWVKEILKCAPGTAIDHFHAFNSEVEEVLNHSVKEDKNTHCHYSDLPSPSAYEE